MSGQLLELVFFAVLAFIICSKLISIVGKTSDRDGVKDDSSLFGESGITRDVHYKEEESMDQIVKRVKERDDAIFKFIEENNRTEETLRQVGRIAQYIENFQLKDFVTGAKKAFIMILSSVKNGNSNSIKDLIDKRYFKTFDQEISKNYKDFQEENLEKLDAKVSDIYFFGNNVFIKVLFSGRNISKLVKDFREEWTFSKNSLIKNKHWHINNIEALLP